MKVAQSANGVESNTPTKKRTDNHKGCRSVEVFTFGEDICTCGLQASLTPLRAICAYRDSGILPDEERVLADSTISVIRTDNIPSGNTPLRKAQM